MLSNKVLRFLFMTIGVIGLFLTYFFQDYLNIYEGLLGTGHWKMPYTGTDYLDKGHEKAFVFNKILRYLLNDLFSISLIHGFFLNKSYTKMAFALMGIGLFFLLPIYLYLYLSALPGLSSLLSHLHRLILNPVLMMLLIPALYYQNKLSDKKSE